MARSLLFEGVVSGPPETLLATAVSKMLEQQTKRFVVVSEQGEPIGLIDRQTALRGLL